MARGLWFRSSQLSHQYAAPPTLKETALLLSRLGVEDKLKRSFAQQLLIV